MINQTKVRTPRNTDVRDVEAFLVEILNDRFSLDELATLAFELGIEPGTLNFSPPKKNTAVEFINYCKNHAMLPTLWNWVADTRKDIGLELWIGPMPITEVEEPSICELLAEAEAHLVKAFNLIIQIRAEL
jgi:hypothetical protein